MGYFNGKNVPENGFTIEDLQAEADRKLAILKAFIAEFIDESDNEPLGSDAQKVASRTPDLYLKKASEICAAAPDLKQMPPRAQEFLDLTYSAQVIFAPVLALAREVPERVHQAMVRKKLIALPVARLVHRIARLIVETGAGKWLSSYVDHMKAILGRPSRKKKAEKAKKEEPDGDFAKNI